MGWVHFTFSVAALWLYTLLLLPTWIQTHSLNGLLEFPVHLFSCFWMAENLSDQYLKSVFFMADGCYLLEVYGCNFLIFSIEEKIFRKRPSYPHETFFYGPKQLPLLNFYFFKFFDKSLYSHRRSNKWILIFLIYCVYINCASFNIFLKARTFKEHWNVKIQKNK